MRLLSHGRCLCRCSVRCFTVAYLHSARLGLYRRCCTTSVVTGVTNVSNHLYLTLTQRSLCFRPRAIVRRRGLSISLIPVLLRARVRRILPVLRSVHHCLIQGCRAVVRRVLPRRSRCKGRLGQPVSLRLHRLRRCLQKRNLFFRRGSSR